MSASPTTTSPAAGGAPKRRILVIVIGVVVALVAATFWSRHDRAALDTAYTRAAAMGTRIDAPNGTHATVQDFKPTVPGKAKDVTGMATPSAGGHLATASVEVCVGSRPVLLGPRDFGVRLADGRLIRPKFPQTLVDDEVATTGEGECHRGEVVFDVPAGATVSAVVLAYDFDRVEGSAASEPVGARLHHFGVDLAWTVPPG
jgi:hypothetical protein